MIVQFLIKAVLSLFGGLFSLFPVVHTLPLVDSYLVSGVGYLRFLITVFPPLDVMLTAFLYYIGFKVVLKGIAMIPVIKGFLYK